MPTDAEFVAAAVIESGYRPTHLVDRDNARIGALDVRCANSLYGGSISFEPTASSTRTLFERFEEIVEGQMFGLLDEIEDQIEALDLRVAFDDGAVASVADLQVYPSTGAVSFVTRQPTVAR